ncbi:MAG TPA: hypothetical protein VHX87_05345 [Galbitalea sp.]|nr:hypothetical protein [Galbitalea sp.]
MRFVLAIVFFVLALATLGTGVAQRTLLAGPDHVTLATTASKPAPVTIIDGAALNAYPEAQTVKLAGTSSTSFAAYGRTSDVMAWVGNTNYTEVRLNPKTDELESTFHHGVATKVPNPSGSDLWLQQYKFGSFAQFRAKIPASMSVIAVSNGRLAAPPSVSVTWPLDNSTPWSGTLILIGAIALIIGIILLLWAFTHLRRTRGPRRSQPRMPKLPKQPRYKTSARSISSGRAAAGQSGRGKGRRAIRNFVTIVPVLGISAALLVGCSAAPAPTVVSDSKLAPKQVGGSGGKIPAVTTVQLQEIVRRISKTVGTADANLDPKLIATRMAGAALEERLANYIVRKARPSMEQSVDIPDILGNYNLPEATKNTWPRSVFTVVKSGSKSNLEYVGLVLIQKSPRVNYKVNYAVTLQPNTRLPNVAPAIVGTTRLDPDIGLLKLQPSAIALAYGAILDEDSAAPSYKLFQSKGDAFRTQVGLASKQQQEATLPKTAKLTYTNSNGDAPIVALVTINSGALVAVDLNETETVKPDQAGAAVTAPGAIGAYLGTVTSTKGITATYGDQLLFYVPPGRSSGKIVLLGYSQGLINAEEL